MHKSDEFQCSGSLVVIIKVKLLTSSQFKSDVLISDKYKTDVERSKNTNEWKR